MPASSPRDSKRTRQLDLHGKIVADTSGDRWINRGSSGKWQPDVLDDSIMGDIARGRSISSSEDDRDILAQITQAVKAAPLSSRRPRMQYSEEKDSTEGENTKSSAKSPPSANDTQTRKTSKRPRVSESSDDDDDAPIKPSSSARQISGKRSAPKEISTITPKKRLLDSSDTRSSILVVRPNYTPKPLPGKAITRRIVRESPPSSSSSEESDHNSSNDTAHSESSTPKRKNRTRQSKAQASGRISKAYKEVDIYAEAKKRNFSSPEKAPVPSSQNSLQPRVAQKQILSDKSSAESDNGEAQECARATNEEEESADDKVEIVDIPRTPLDLFTPDSSPAPISQPSQATNMIRQKSSSSEIEFLEPTESMSAIFKRQKLAKAAAASISQSSSPIKPRASSQKSQQAPSSRLRRIASDDELPTVEEASQLRRKDKGKEKQKPVSAPRKRPTKRRPASSDSEPPVERTKKRRKRKRRSLSAHSSDVDDLEMDFETVQDNRLRSSPQKLNKKLARLEASRALKAAKAKRAAALAKGTLLDSDEETAAQEKLKQVTKSSTSESDSGDTTTTADNKADSDNFVLSDDEDVPDEETRRAMLPPELTSANTQPLSWHMKNFVNLLVHMCLLPDETDFGNDLAISKRKIQSLLTDTIESLVRSQAWGANAVRAIELPEIAEEPLDEVLDGCDACRMGGRKARTAIIYSGHYYNRDTYRNLVRKSRKKGQISSDSDSDTSSSDDSDEGAHKTVRLQIGSECLKRARIHHGLRHFEWTVYQQVKQLVRRYRLSDPKKRQPEGDKAQRKWAKERMQDVGLIVDKIRGSRFAEGQMADLTNLMDFAKTMYLKGR